MTSGEDRNTVLLRRVTWESTGRGNQEYLSGLDLTFLSIGGVDREIVDCVTQFHLPGTPLKTLGTLMIEAAREYGLEIRRTPQRPSEYLWASSGAWKLEADGQEEHIDHGLRDLVPCEHNCVRAFRLDGWNKQRGCFSRFDQDIEQNMDIPAIFINTQKTPFKLESGSFRWPLRHTDRAIVSLPNSLGIKGLQFADV